jgi:hypothetical protein
MAELPRSDRTRVRREPKRGAYDRATIDAILDEGIVCHLGFVHDCPCPFGTRTKRPIAAACSSR